MLGISLSYEHVAVGINDGSVTIRKNPKDLDRKSVPDIEIGKDPIVNLEYTEYGDLLLVMDEKFNFVFLDVIDIRK